MRTIRRLVVAFALAGALAALLSTVAFAGTRVT
jgi:hypothetical protein